MKQLLSLGVVVTCSFDRSSGLGIEPTRPPSHHDTTHDSGFYRAFVPITAAGQREIYTPLPWIVYVRYWCYFLLAFTSTASIEGHTSCILPVGLALSFSEPATNYAIFSFGGFKSHFFLGLIFYYVLNCLYRLENTG